jgi:hypothetical protein
MDMQEALVIESHLSRALACLARGDVNGARDAARAAASARDGELVVDEDCRGFSFAGRNVSLLRSGRLRNIFEALVQRAEQQPGIALTRDDVLEAGWPGERMRPESGALRVYTAIRRLRQSGLGDALVTRDDGYVLDGVTLLRRRRPR